MAAVAGRLAVASVFLGFFLGICAGVGVGTVAGGILGTLAFLVVWFGFVALVGAWAERKFAKQKTKGSKFSTVILTEETLTTAGTYPKVLNAADVIAVGAGTKTVTYTHKGGLDRKIKEAEAKKEVDKSYKVTVDYGADEIDVIGRVLNQRQATAIKAEILEWLGDPIAYCVSAKTATI